MRASGGRPSRTAARGTARREHAGRCCSSWSARGRPRLDERHRHVLPLGHRNCTSHDLVDRVLEEAAEHEHRRRQARCRRREAACAPAGARGCAGSCGPAARAGCRAQPLEDGRAVASPAAPAASPRPAAARPRGAPRPSAPSSAAARLTADGQRPPRQAAQLVDEARGTGRTRRRARSSPTPSQAPPASADHAAEQRRSTRPSLR